MNAFESIIASILDAEGFWTRTNYKVNLTPEQKKKIGRPTTPRWDIDVVAYRPAENLVRIVECKSWLDSGGVKFRGFDPATNGTPRFKLFNDDNLAETISQQLMHQLDTDGLLRGKPNFELCLAAPNIYEKDRQQIQQLFDDNGWSLFDRNWIVTRLAGIAADGYEDSTVSIMAKLLAPNAG